MTLVDIDPARAPLAQALGAAFAVPDAAPGDCDVVFHASGAASGLAAALELAGDEATVLEMSWHGAGEVPVALGGAFHSAPAAADLESGRPRRALAPAALDDARRLAAALQLLGDAGSTRCIAPPVRFHELPERLANILAREGGALCPIVIYPAAENAA